MSGPGLFVVGLSHQSAPVAVREGVACSGDALRASILRLRSMDGVEEAMVLSTCNRVEVYVIAHDSGPARRYFTDLAPDVGPHLQERCGSSAARHLFRVAASLDSMVVGEPQILGQVKEAYGIASALQAAGPIISRLCNRVFAAAKRVRSETDIARGAGSVSQVAVQSVEGLFGNVRGRTVLLVGAGKMGASAAKALTRLGAERILVVNRSDEAGQALALRVGGGSLPWEHLFQALVSADVALVSTGASTHVVTADLARRVIEARGKRPICLIDLSVPRNVDPACRHLAGAHVFDMDDLQEVVRTTQASRAEEAVRAEAIIEHELASFQRDRRARAALPVLVALRRKAHEIARAESSRALAQLSALLDDRGRQSVEAMAQAIVNKLLHAPTERLKRAAAHGDSALPDLAAELFDIDDESDDELEDPASNV